MPELDLLVVGDVNPDVIVGDPELEARFGQAEQFVDHAAVVVGGSASITAMGAARLGLSVGLCGVVGDDDLGWIMEDRLTTAGVNLRHLDRDPSLPTGMSVVLDRGSDRAILTHAGTISALTAEDLDALPDRPARHVHISSYFLMSQGFQEALPSVLSRFHAAGVSTSVDTNWDPAGRWDVGAVLERCDVWLPNEAELLAVTRTQDRRTALRAARTRGCDVVAKLGDEGALAQTERGNVRVTATPASVFVDAIGAGDSFNAGYLVARLSGENVEAAVRLAVAAGTLSTRDVGGTAAQPDLVEARAWAAALGVTSGEVSQ